MNNILSLINELNNHLSKSKECLEQITKQIDNYQLTNYLYNIIDMIFEIEKIAKKEKEE